MIVLCRFSNTYLVYKGIKLAFGYNFAVGKLIHIIESLNPDTYQRKLYFNVKSRVKVQHDIKIKFLPP